LAGHANLTLRDLLRLALPAGTVVVAGYNNMNQPVSWVHVLNTRPPAFPDLQGGELALLSLDAMRLLSDKLTLVQLIRDLAQMDVAGIGVQGDIGQPSQEMADAQHIPLLRLPETADLRHTEHQIAQVLMGHPIDPEERGQEVREQLLQLSTENRGLEALAKAISAMVGKTVVVQDKRLRPRAV
jgi:purine catabolism regulator